MLTENQKKVLKTNLEIAKIASRKSRYEYLGLLSEYQLHSKSVDKLNYKSLNPYQHFLFKRVLHGLNIYSKDEIQKMHWDKKRRIKKVWSKGQHCINEMKQYLVYQITNQIFAVFRPEVKEAFSHPFEYNPEIRNTSTLKELGLTYEDLIIKFMSEGLLPKNFLDLQPDEYEKRIKKAGNKKQEVLTSKKRVLN